MILIFFKCIHWDLEFHLFQLWILNVFKIYFPFFFLFSHSVFISMKNIFFVFFFLLLERKSQINENVAFDDQNDVWLKFQVTIFNHQWSIVIHRDKLCSYILRSIAMETTKKEEKDVSKIKCIFKQFRFLLRPS